MRTLDLGLVDLKSLDPWRWTLVPLELGIALLDSVTLRFCTLTLCTLSRRLRRNWRYSLLGLLLYPGKPSLSPIWSDGSFLQGNRGSWIGGLVSQLNIGPGQLGKDWYGVGARCRFSWPSEAPMILSYQHIPILVPFK